MLAETILSFAIGLGAILVAANIFLSLSHEFAAKWRLSPLFISLVVVAFGTTLPELTVTLASVIQRDPGLALGNTVGSTITNITLIFGVTILFGSVKLGTKKTQLTARILFATVSIFILLQLSSLTATTRAIALLATLGLALSYEYLLALNGRLHEDKKLIHMLSLKKRRTRFPGVIGVLAFITSIAGLGVGGMITVKAVNQLSAILDISTTLLGLSLTALATSLPELVMATVASRKQENKVVVGTLVGSNLFNLTLFPAIVFLSFGSQKLPPGELTFLFLATLCFTALTLTFRGRVVSRWVGIVLLSLYAAFLYMNLGSYLAQ